MPVIMETATRNKTGKEFAGSADAHILVADDDNGHTTLIRRNLERMGLGNPISYFKDGQEIVDFLFKKGDGPHMESDRAYLLLLDIRMPKLDGVEVLRRIRKVPRLKEMPVVVVTTTDDPRDIDRCSRLGCLGYIKKPIDYKKFVNVIRGSGLFPALKEPVNKYSGSRKLR